MTWKKAVAAAAVLLLVFVLPCCCGFCIKDDNNLHVACTCEYPRTQISDILGNFSEPKTPFSLTIADCQIENATLPDGAENVTVFHHGFLFVKHFRLPNVKTLEFRNILYLRLEQPSLEQVNHLEVLRLDNINQLEIGAETFSLVSQLEEMTIENSTILNLKENAMSFNVSQFRLSESKLTFRDLKSINVVAKAAILERNSFYVIDSESMFLSADEIFFTKNIVHHLKAYGFVLKAKKFHFSNNHFQLSESDAFSSITFQDGEFFEFHNNTLHNLPDATLLDINFQSMNPSITWNSHLQISNNTIPCSCHLFSHEDKSVSDVKNIYYEQFRQGKTKCYKSSEMLDEFIENHCSKLTEKSVNPVPDDDVVHLDDDQRQTTTEVQYDYDIAHGNGRNSVKTEHKDIVREHSPIAEHEDTVARKGTVNSRDEQDDHHSLDRDHETKEDNDENHKKTEDEHIHEHSPTDDHEGSVARKVAGNKNSRDQDNEHKGQQVSTTEKPSTDSSTGHLVGPVIIVIIAIIIMIAIVVCIFLKYRKMSVSSNKV